MIKHIWTVVTQKSIIDSETNNVSLIDLIEKITINLPLESKTSNEKKSVQGFNFDIFSYLVRDNDSLKKGSADFRYEIHDPENQVLNKFEKTAEFGSDVKRIRIRLKVNGITVTTPGTYNFVAFLKRSSKWETIATIPVEVVFKASESTKPLETSKK